MSAVNNHPTHGQVSPSGVHGYVMDSYRPVPDQLRLTLGKLDGQEKYTYSIWRTTAPGDLHLPPREPGPYFMQSAGASDAMTIEVRLPGADGEGRLYVVGRQEPTDGTTTVLPISDECAVRVFSNEVFTADEAAVIFSTYYLTDTVSQEYALRELDLTEELSEKR